MKVLVTVLVGVILVGGCESAFSTGDDSYSQGLVGVTGGHETNYEEWQGVIALADFMNGHSCTGTLIAPDVVLSAAHCVKFGDSSWSDLTSHPQDLHISGGATSGDIDYGVAERIIVHPRWAEEGRVNEFDLTLVKLAEPIEHVAHYQVRRAPEPEIGELGWLVGYGRSCNDAGSSGIHRAGETTLQEKDLYYSFGDVAKNCAGDSGGPFFTKQDGEWVVAAVAHLVGDDCSISGVAHSIGVLTLRDWIEDTFRELAGYELGEDPPMDSPIDAGEDAGANGPDDNSGWGCSHLPTQPRKQSLLWKTAEALCRTI